LPPAGQTGTSAKGTPHKQVFGREVCGYQFLEPLLKNVQLTK